MLRRFRWWLFDHVVPWDTRRRLITKKFDVGLSPWEERRLALITGWARLVEPNWAPALPPHVQALVDRVLKKEPADGE
jgi:hypothetical protein